MAAIKHMLQIKTPAADVFRAITEQSGLAAWWTPQAEAEPKLDAILKFRFGERYYNEMSVTELIPNRKVRWHCQVGEKEWVGTELVFELEDQGEQTTLRFTHEGWREMTDFFATCNYHWGYYLRSIKLLCETGKGTPFSA